LAQDDYNVTMREESTGFVQNETLEREATRLAGLHLGADLAFAERFSLGAGHDVAQQLGGETSHDVTARVSWRF
jgi:hypothetical protein